MPRMALEFKFKPENRSDNFQQIIGLAEKLFDSLAKKLQRIETTNENTGKI